MGHRAKNEVQIYFYNHDASQTLLWEITNAVLGYLVECLRFIFGIEGLCCSGKLELCELWMLPSACRGMLERQPRSELCFPFVLCSEKIPVPKRW